MNKCLSHHKHFLNREGSRPSRGPRDSPTLLNRRSPDRFSSSSSPPYSHQSTHTLLHSCDPPSSSPFTRSSSLPPRSPPPSPNPSRPRRPPMLATRPAFSFAVLELESSATSYTHRGSRYPPRQSSTSPSQFASRARCPPGNATDRETMVRPWLHLNDHY